GHRGVHPRHARAPRGRAHPCARRGPPPRPAARHPGPAHRRPHHGRRLVGSGPGPAAAPGLPQWLSSPEASRLTGSPRAHPPALRALRDLGGTDAALLWLAEVEALPLPTAAHRLGLDPATVRTELDRVRALFRERWRRALGDAPEPEAAGLAAVLADGVLGWGGLDYLERRRRPPRRGPGPAGPG
ncbi:cellulose-binding protein, partial [Streptomyces sp. SID4946]|nr:cellulose-binding protein [Streptomyces sp. SID4946]